MHVRLNYTNCTKTNTFLSEVDPGSPVYQADDTLRIWTWVRKVYTQLLCWSSWHNQCICSPVPTKPSATPIHTNNYHAEIGHQVVHKQIAAHSDIANLEHKIVHISLSLCLCLSLSLSLSVCLSVVCLCLSLSLSLCVSFSPSLSFSFSSLTLWHYLLTIWTTIDIEEDRISLACGEVRWVEYPGI